MMHLRLVLMGIIFRGMRVLLGLMQRIFNLLALGEWPPFAGVAVILRDGDRVLFIERSDGNGYGLPGGFVRLDETAEAAAIRETLEETGLHVELEGIVGILSGERADTLVRTVDVVYRARIIAGDVRPSREGTCLWLEPDTVRDEIAFGYGRLL